MITEIKRNRWRGFLRKLNAENKYRDTNITLNPIDGTEKKDISIDQFIGITLRKYNGRIDAIEITQATPDPNRIAQPIASLGQPAHISVKKTKHGTVCHILITDKEGNSAKVKFSGARDEASTTQLVEKLAYAIFERRGAEPGHHNDDWLEAEEKIRQVEAEILK